MGGSIWTLVFVVWAALFVLLALTTVHWVSLYRNGTLNRTELRGKLSAWLLPTLFFAVTLAAFSQL